MSSENQQIQRQIAEAFSNGEFEFTYPFLAESVEWNIIGENSFSGKQAVIEQCAQTANYFQTVSTEFNTLNVIVGENRVAINGTALFLRNGEKLANVSSCDVYEFNDRNELQKVDSYCITHPLPTR